MRPGPFLLALGALCAAAAVAWAGSLPAPTPLPQKGSCPFGYASDSRYCTPGAGARFAVMKGPSGSCPSGYGSEVAYCVAGPHARLAIPRQGGSCPFGYANEGDFCVSSR